MSPQQQDAPATSRPRPRANTSFGAFPWRLNRRDAAPTPATPAAPVQTQPIETLIQALSPPAVPSLVHARSLVTALSTQTPPPSSATLTPILYTLCSSQVPSLQAAGFDILSAYCVCSSRTFTTSDGLAYFDLFRIATNVWALEVWEPRFKALNTLLSSSADSAHTDKLLLDLVVGWITCAFDGILVSTHITLAERQERERTIETLADFLTSWVNKPENAGRLTDQDVTSLFDSYANLIDRGLQVPADAVQYLSVPSTPLRESNPTGISSPARHRRHPSSTSGMTSPPSAPTPRTTVKHPAQLVACVYLNHLDTQLSRLPLSYLPTLLPLLFRILASYMSPLPVITLPLTPTSPTFEVLPQPTIEVRVNKAISALLSGPYSTYCITLLKRHLMPLPDADVPPHTLVKIAVGAHRTLRLHIRRVLGDRLAMFFISRTASSTATPAGAPGVLSLNQYVLDRAQRAWSKEGNAAWDARKIGFLLTRAVKAWIAWSGDDNDAMDVGWKEMGIGKEKVLEEIAGLLKDVLQEMDERAEHEAEETYDDNASAVGEILRELVNYIPPLKNDDGSPLVIPLTRPMDAPTPLLRTLAALLAREHNQISQNTYIPTAYHFPNQNALSPPSLSTLNPPLPIILLSIAEHLPDKDTAKLPQMMSEQHHLSPTAPEWLDNWQTLLSNGALFAAGRPHTRRAVMIALQSVHESIKDMPTYRRPLAELIFDFWIRLVQEANEGVDGSVMWRVLGDEVVLRSFEDDADDEAKSISPGEKNMAEIGNVSIEKILDAMNAVASIADSPFEDEPTPPPETTPTSPLVPTTPSQTPSTSSSPILSRTQTDGPGQVKDKEPGIQLMSLLSFATGSAARAQSSAPVSAIEEPSSALSRVVSPPADPVPPSGALTAVVALIDVFSQLAFSDRLITVRHASLALHVFDRLLTLLQTAQCPKARLAVLQFLMRLRADRDHRIYLKSDPLTHDPHVATLSALIGRVSDSPGQTSRSDDTRQDDSSFDEARRARPKHVFVERDGRRASRGRGSQASNPTPSRSRSRAARVKAASKQSVNAKPKDPIWCIPDVVLFSMENADKASQALLSYDPVVPDHKLVLLVSSYLQVLVEILKTERDWEILSYALVHLPNQLANKHFWCGPKTREAIVDLLTELCKGISEGTLGKYVPPDGWPAGLKARDAQGLAYHTLTVLISYHNIFENNMRHALVEVFQAGLSGMPPTVKCCLQALSLAAFELPQSMIKFLPRILEKLSQIMTNPSMAVHILDFLSIVGSIPTLYANFTENDFKMVFGVALQYLQHHNRPETLAEISFALAQHVRLVSYYLLYVWFLAVRLPDRRLHVKFIGKQLLLANEGKDEVDEPTEVCFDWLARYTYASADPRPAPSLLNEIVSEPPTKQPAMETSLQEKSWIVGHSIVTIRTLAKVGWVEMISRRASGTTKFLCKSENVPLVGLGDVDPDIASIPASLMMDKEPTNMRQIVTPRALAPPPNVPSLETKIDDVDHLFATTDNTEDMPSRPDPLTGYVWSGTAPSQRRKHVDLDPSFFPLQFSAYPDIRGTVNRGRIVRDAQGLARQIRTLDRMPVIDTHKVGIMYVAPGQTSEVDILRNTHGSPAYTRFLEGIGRLLKLRGQVDVYAGGLDPDEDGEYAYAWWDDIGQVLYHTATLMPTHDRDERCNNKKKHIGNDFVRIVWNDSGLPYRFDTLATEFQFVNIVIEPHSHGAIAAFSNNLHENEYFKVTIQRAEGMGEFAPIGDFKIVSANSLPLLTRQLSLLSDWYASVFQHTARDTEKNEFITNWRGRLQILKRFAASIPTPAELPPSDAGIMGQEAVRDFTTGY